MKKLILLFILFCFTNSLSAQSFPQWGKLEKGPYDIGYKDTMIFKSNENFKFNSYNGYKPFFIGIWYPASNSPSQPYMRFSNYLDYPKQTNYENLFDSLIRTFHKILIKDGICIDLNSYDEISFDDKYKKLYEDVLNTTVNAKMNLPALRQKFPCIIYHHGAQSAPYDNNVFCEYMASYGFVVVSSNFNLPDQSRPGFLTSASDKKFNFVSDLEFVVNIVKKMANVDSTKMVAAGHSLGAQVELQFDDSLVNKPFKKIISFHTTLEDRTVNQARSIWSYFNYLYDNHCKNSTTPTALFAPIYMAQIEDSNEVTGKVTNYTDSIFPGFEVFKNNTTTAYTFITVKHNVKHDGFITLGNLRQPYIEKYNLQDKQAQISQQFFYEEIVILARKIAEAAVNGKPYSIDERTKNNFVIKQK